MSTVRYSATFQLPNGEELVFSRESLEDYGYTWAWLLLAGVDDDMKQGAILAKGFSRTRKNAESAAQVGVKIRQGRVALFAPVTK